MNRTLRRITALFLAAIALSAGRPARAQDSPPPAPDGATVQPRGPVHEAFARPADAPGLGPVVPREPPALIEELPPEQRPEGDTVQWVRGYWAWDDEAKDFLWVSGCWRVPPPGHTWVAGKWVGSAAGWQWRAGYWAGAGADAPRPLPAAPPASLEVGPSAPAPADDSYYVPGQWVFRDGEWAWQPGSWVPNPGGMAYTPPAYVPAPGGSLYVPGYWDYPLEDRGLLFAPVAFAGSPWVGNPGWAYRPGYAVGVGGLLGSLFVRSGYGGGYYFGNYFGGPYRNLGYTPWSAYAGRGYDPLLSHYRWANRGNPGWAGGLSGLYAGRLNGSLPVPATQYGRPGGVNPVVAPNVIARNTAAFGRGVSVNPVNSLQTVQPLGQFNGGHVRLTSAGPQNVNRPQFQNRPSFASPLSGLGAAPNPVARQAFPSPAPARLGNPVARPTPAARSFQSQPTFRAAPVHQSQPAFRSVPAHAGGGGMRGGPAFHGGGGGGHGGGHRR